MAVNLIEPPDGVFQAKSNTGSDDWSVILPYIDRRKYTIGDKYISWATQGDFVFFRTKGDQWNWRFGLEILCDDDFYWVKPGQGDIIFQNGVKLDDKVETRLNFNDTLIVTKLRNNISGGLAIFTFNKREYPENWDTCKKMELCGSEKAPESSFTLDRNQLIFSQILSHLSLGSLKNARLVCRHWDEEVTPILQRKCVINFSYSSDVCNPSMRLLRYVHDMRYVEGQTRNRPNWQNWKVTIPDLQVTEDNQKNWRDKYVADLKWFLKPRRGHHVTSLSLTGYIYADADYLLYLDTVSQFKNTLEELSVNVVMDISKNDGPEHQYSQRSELFFPVLKKFSLRLGNHWGRIPATVTTNWMKTWADAVTRVTTIFTDGRVSLGSRFVEEMQKTGTLRYQNLMEISLTCEPEDAINFLRELNQPLKTFLACEIACYTSSH